MRWLQRLFGGSKPQDPVAERESAARVAAALKQIRARAQPCLHIVPARSAASRLGGAPDVAAGFEWPRRGQIPLSFLAQIDLAEVRAQGGPDWLPDRGRLLFFYEANSGGADPDDLEFWRLLHLSATEGLSRAPFPPDLRKKARFDGYRIRFTPGRSLPSFEHTGDITSGLSKKEDALVEERLAALEREREPDHRIGGWAQAIQHDNMQVACELAARGVSADSSKPPDADVAAAAQGWRLLFQLDSDERMGADWVDAGRLFFWIREQDARRGDFSQVRMVMQSY